MSIGHPFLLSRSEIVPNDALSEYRVRGRLGQEDRNNNDVRECKYDRS